MSDAARNVELFCKKPVNKEAEVEAQRKWKEFVEEATTYVIPDFMERPEARTARVRRKMVEAISSAPADLLYDLGCAKNRDRFGHFVKLVQEELGHWKSTFIRVLIEPSPEAIFTQVYKGEVTSVDGEDIIVRFKVGDDLEERRFAIADRFSNRPIQEGQPVQARCQLELVQPTRPLTYDEIREYESQYDGIEEHLDKRKRGNDFLENKDK